MASDADREEQVCAEVWGKIVSLDEARIDRVYYQGMGVILDEPVNLGAGDSVVVSLDDYRYRRDGEDRAEKMASVARSVELAP